MTKRSATDLAYVHDLLIQLRQLARPYPTVAYLIGVAAAAAEEEWLDHNPASATTSPPSANVSSALVTRRA